MIKIEQAKKFVIYKKNVDTFVDISFEQFCFMIDTMFKIKLCFQIKLIISGATFEKFIDKGFIIYEIHGKP